MRFRALAVVASFAAQSAMAFVVPGSTSVGTRGRPSAVATVTSKSTPTTAGTLLSSPPTTTSLSAVLLSPPGGFDSSLHLADAAASTFTSVTSSPLFVYFAERVIESAVPAVFVAAVIFFFFAQFRGARTAADGEDDEAENTNAVAELYNDLYGTTRGGGVMGGRRQGGRFGGGFRPGAPPLPKNLGLPKKEFLKVTSMNEKFDAYDYSLQTATTSKAQAAANFRSKAFSRAVGVALDADGADGGVPPAAVRAALVRAERAFLREGGEAVRELQTLEAKLAQITMDAELKKMGVADPLSTSSAAAKNATASAIDAEIVAGEPSGKVMAAAAAVATNATDAELVLQLAATPTRGQEELLKKMAKTQKTLKELELGFIQQVISAVGPKRAVGLRNALLGDITVRGIGGLLTQLQERPLATILRADGPGAGGRPKNLFVMNFPGDVQASQLNELREEVTGVIRNAQPGDEALVVLQSGGGTVTGYGLAAGQLVRLKDKGLFLTIAVEQVAASGGYMMSCVADRIVASPFAVLGSIGVISEIPNVYERLKQEGIEFQTVTAGKFKRTLTPTKKINKEDVAKSKEEIEEIFQLFKGWVAQNRPQLNIDEVATGETWFGPAALEKGLCDDIKTVDDILLEYVDLGYKVFEVKYDPPPEVPSSLSFLFASENGGPQAKGNSIVRRGIRWLVQSVAEEVQAAVSDSKSIENRYLVKDETADRVRASDDFFY